MTFRTRIGWFKHVKQSPEYLRFEYSNGIMVLEIAVRGVSMAVVIDLSKPVNWSEVSIIAAEAAGWKVETAKRVEKVFVWPRTDRTTYVNQGEPFVVHQDGTRLTVPPYAEDDSAAWSLIQLMIRQGFRPEIRLEQDGKWHVALHKQDEDTQVVYEASHESFAKAAVLAVVQAAGVRVLISLPAG